LEWQRPAGALLLLGGASRELRARERAEKTKKKLLAGQALLPGKRTSELRVGPAESLPGSCAGAMGAAVAQMVVDLAPAGHGNGERMILELRSAMSARR
jgi:hypothetical protein